jgi:hypothetical protein
MNVIDLWRVVGFCILLFVLLLLFLAEVRRQCRPLPAIAAKSCGFVGVILSAGAAIILGDWSSHLPPRFEYRARIQRLRFSIARHSCGHPCTMDLVAVR